MTNPAPNWQYPQAQSSGLWPGAPGVLPDSMKWAVGLMWAGAGMSIIYNVLSGVMSNSVLSMQASHTTANHDARVGGYVVGAILQTALWLWMIWKVRAGRPWARVLSTVFFGIMCLTFLIGVLLAPAASKLLISVYFTVALSALIMLYQRDSSAFFAAAKLAEFDFAGRFGQPGYGPPGYSPGYGPPGYGPPGYGPPGYEQPQFGQVPQQYPQSPHQGGQQTPPPQ